ncbi:MULTISPECIES: glycosyltransferase family 4 protein [Spirosoma]|uniref:Glycosyltransferase family 4 protein n=1 Tax=Spirosoma liriopis TaxID=2937440 RepID=A0ABT0HDZ9_9BACT|nr:MULTISPECIES: glycosyltransferase family 1 protein [Spirosoma]MCK8490380.1 glycosyltransferase family 4 protein [Spirosoma liriopis]UHG89753.1 glycosyltransferase family 4 protein [Spirosoma oryzicola]
MINVFIDHQKFTTQKYGGISRYFANIIQGIKQTKDISYKLGVLHAKNHYIQNEPLALKGKLGDRILGRKERYDYELNKFYCQQLLKKNEFDVFHPTYYDPYFLQSLKKPLVITIHDLTYERLPEYFWAQDPLTYQKRLNIDRADSIITISQTTRKDLLSFFDVDPAKVSVIYHGIDIETPLRVQPVDQLPKQYLLFVGDRSGYKNFYLFMNAFQKIAHRFPDLHVILTGGGKLEIADREFLNRLRLTDRVRHINATDEQLNFLYQNAQLFVYPSLYEGFGLPILEAFKARCPMLLSDTECFREVAADAAVYFEPTSMDDLIDKLETVLTGTTLKAQLVEKGVKRLADFPLQKSIDQTLDVYKSLVSPRSAKQVLV